MLEKAKRMKMVMNLEDFKNIAGKGEVQDYIISIWDEVEVPFTLYGSED